MLMNRWFGFPIGLLVCCFVLGGSQARAQVSTARKSLPKEYCLGKIRVHYDTEGPHAVDPADVNHNGQPDQVEDIAKQAWAAYTLFVEALGFPDPFQTERFRSAAFLDIHLLDKKTLGSNGVAYDELQKFRRPSDPEGTQSLCYNVATSVKATQNLTPAHEMFHIIQYGTTYFKNAWYSEGTARWSERALGLGGVGEIRYQGPWPLTDERRDQVFKMSYSAAGEFWNPLAMLDDSRGEIPKDRVSRELRELTYAGGDRVLKDLQFNGWELIRDVLLELAKADRVAFRELGYDRWSEENQNSPKNSPYIYQAVMEVLRRRHRLP
jgi:hypothetical protein